MIRKYDIIVIGSGPGGYVAAIRASQLGKTVAIVEKAEPGGICLNWGCIPTKALLKSAQVYQYVKKSTDFGIDIAGTVTPQLEAMVKRSRVVAGNMSKGIQFLMRKNKIDVIQGFGALKDHGTVEVTDREGNVLEYHAENIILATGARSRELPNIKIDGMRIIGYREALTLQKLPDSMLIIGSGAIGSEFAWFYNSLGTKVTLVEYMPDIVPLEDTEVSKLLERSFKKDGIEILTGSSVEEVIVKDNKCNVTIKTPAETVCKEVDIVLSAVGITSNIENIGLEKMGILVSNGKIIVDSKYQTNVPGIYAIGDIIPGPALAHVASAEGIFCVEKIAGLNPEILNYHNIPSCIYTVPEVASVGITEKEAHNKGIAIKVGRFPFSASGKANAAGEKEGFAKIILNAETDELLGAHLIGMNVTEMIAELVVAKKMNATGHDILKSIHPHPTISEAIMEAAAQAYNEAIHL
jgi:dihydrolipoamide dehydrogenase